MRTFWLYFCIGCSTFLSANLKANTLTLDAAITKALHADDKLKQSKLTEKALLAKSQGANT